jgi:hypothetical protein
MARRSHITLAAISFVASAAMCASAAIATVVASVMAISCRQQAGDALEEKERAKQRKQAV